MNEPYPEHHFSPPNWTSEVSHPVPPKPPATTEKRRWLPPLLFGITVLTTIWAGTLQQEVDIFADPLNFRFGIAFSFTLLLILGVHEFGHYFFCRVHHVPATVPYFIPMPNILGTMGAFIKIKGAIRNRRALLDIGMAGPLAGFCLALPATIIGYMLSTPVPALTSQGMVLGDSLLTIVIQKLIFPDMPREFTLLLHPVAFAGYIGLLVTAMNLLPVGQLDGGHIASALFGRKQWQIGRLFLFLLIPLGLLWQGWWFWLVILLFFGYRHPVIHQDARALNPVRRRLAWTAIVIFFITFVPAPFQFNF